MPPTEAERRYQKLYYHKHRDKIVAYQQAYHQTRRWLSRMQAIEYLGGVCKHCGYKDNLSALQFDHRDPATKRYSISSMFSNQGKIILYTNGSILPPATMAELDKCDLLCANCHAIKSTERGEYMARHPNREIVNASQA